MMMFLATPSSWFFRIQSGRNLNWKSWSLNWSHFFKILGVEAGAWGTYLKIPELERLESKILNSERPDSYLPNPCSSKRKLEIFFHDSPIRCVLCCVQRLPQASTHLKFLNPILWIIFPSTGTPLNCVQELSYN